MSARIRAAQRRGPPDVTGGWVLAAAIVLVLCLPSAAAQVGPDLAMSADRSSVNLGPNQTTTVNITVENTGETGGTVTVSVAGVDGWRAQLPTADQSFTLDSGDSRTLTLTLAPQAAAPENGTVTVSAEITDAVGQTDSAQANVGVAYVAPDPPPPPPPPPDYLTPFLLALAAAVLLYVIPSATFSLRVTERSSRLTNGSSEIYLVRIRNWVPWPRRIGVRVRGLPRPWAAAFPAHNVRVTPFGTEEIPFAVKVPLSWYQAGEVRFRVQARPNRISPWMTRRRVDAYLEPDGAMPVETETAKDV